ncbi:MAG TPA: hypothetical protein VGO26_03160 [Amnibacterium sp.]|jgi:hypothetical protein|nr:hypothetical protein [Amnibacterium sp.]
MSITVSAAPRGAGAPTRGERIGSLAMTGALLLLRHSSGSAVTSIQAHPHALSTAAAAPIGR